MSAPRGLTDAQRAMRLTGVGASEVAAIVGESPYGGPLSVYLEKVDPEHGFAGNFATRRGHALEGLVAHEYELATGRQTDRKSVV